MKIKNYDKDAMYECPVCKEKNLSVKDSKTVECHSCDFVGIVKREIINHEDDLHITIEGEVYKFVEEKICMVVNNEYVCVEKHGEKY